jgi:hypothetical protein
MKCHLSALPPLAARRKGISLLIEFVPNKGRENTGKNSQKADEQKTGREPFREKRFPAPRLSGSSSGNQPLGRSRLPGGTSATTGSGPARQAGAIADKWHQTESAIDKARRGLSQVSCLASVWLRPASDTKLAKLRSIVPTEPTR